MAEFEQYKYQDRQINDTTLYNQFLTYWQQGNYTAALNVIVNNASLSTKAFTAGAINTIGAALTYLQDNYFNDVEKPLAENLDAFNLAISHFVTQLNYNETKQYYINNFVLYNNQYYMCIKNSQGNLPTDTNYWVLLGLQGIQGAAGTGLNLKYSWSVSETYAQYDVVYLGNVLYVALQSNTNKNPTITTGYWQILMRVPATTITVSKMPPNYPYNGQIWMKILMPYTWEEINTLGRTWNQINSYGYTIDYINEGGW